MVNHLEETNLEISHSYNLRHTRPLKQAVTRLVSTEKSIHIQGEKLWNEIPQSAKLLSSFSGFKREIKAMLLQNED